MKSNPTLTNVAFTRRIVSSDLTVNQSSVTFSQVKKINVTSFSLFNHSLYQPWQPCYSRHSTVDTWQSSRTGGRYHS